MENLLQDHSAADDMGKLTFLAALFMNIWNWLSHVDINQTLVVLTSLGGLVYMYFKIRITIFDWRERKERKKNAGE